MKHIQNTIGGRIKINVGPWADVEAIVINDNLGVIIHAFSSKDEPKKIDEQFSTDDHQPFSKELNDLWANVRKDEELKGLMDNPGFRIVLKALTIAKTHFPVLYESKSGFFNGEKERKVYLYKGKKKFGEKDYEVTFNKKEFRLPSEYDLPKNLMDGNTPKFKDFSLIPLKKQNTGDNFFYPLHDSTWEIEFDIEVVSTIKKAVVVLNPDYLMGKNDSVAGKLKNYEEKNKSNLKWEYSEILDYIKQNDYGSKTLQNLFDDKMKNIIADEILSKYRKEQMDALSFNFDTEFKELKNEIGNILLKEKPTQNQLSDTDAIYEYIKAKILTKTGYNYKDLNHFLTNGLTNLLLKYTQIYSQWQQDKEKKVNGLVETYKKGEDFTKKLEDAFVGKLKGKTKLKDVCKDTNGKLTACNHEDLKLGCKDATGNLTCKLNDEAIKDLKDKKVSDWIKENEGKLDRNNKKPTLEELSETKYTKQFGAVDELYELAMSPKERAAYEYEKYHDISNKYIKKDTNQVDNFGGWFIGVNEVQFKFKRTLSEELRTKLTEAYNNTDVFQSEIVAKQNELKEKKTLLAEVEAELAKKTAELRVQENLISTINTNNTYFKGLFDSYKSIYSDVSKITTFDNVEIDAITSAMKETLKQSFSETIINADTPEKKEKLRFFALSIEKYDDASKTQAEGKKITLVNEISALTNKKGIKKTGDDTVATGIFKEIDDINSNISTIKTQDEERDKESKLIVKLSEHPRLALHPDWFDKETKKLKFPTLQDRVMTALKEFGK